MTQTTRPVVLACALALGLLAARPTLAEPGPTIEPGPEPIGHKHLEAEHRALPRESFGGLPRPPSASLPTHLMDTRGGPQVRREVMGYLPYWSYTADAPYIPMRWDLLTILAWFSVEMDGTGAITNRRGWGGQTTARIVQDAHLHGVKVIITITNFTNSEIATLVNSAANRQRAINNCLLLMSEHSADGINIDFEFVPSSARNGFVTFMTELKDAVRAAQPNGWEGHVSLAGPAVDWNGAYDYDVLLENTDGIMVMAYGYHWSGSNPGPNSPLATGNLWSGRSISWTVDDYLTYGEFENRGKVLIGLPWYGRDWKVANTNVPGVSAGSGGSRTFRVAEPEALSLGKNWEDISKSVYYHRTANNQLYQVWYDDGRAFEAKVAYVDQRDLGGIGIWALGYEGAYPDLWDAIDKVLRVPDPDPEPVEPGPEPVEPGPEPVEAVEPVEPGPEAEAEPAVEDPAEPTPEPPPEAAEVVEGSPPRVIETSRGVALHEARSEGCAGGGQLGWISAVLGLVGLGLLRSRAVSAS